RARFPRRRRPELRRGQDRPARRRRGRGRKRLLMTFLTPLAALAALAALLPLAAGALGGARAAAVARTLGLPAPRRSAGLLRRVAGACAIAPPGLAAAPPAPTP